MDVILEQSGEFKKTLKLLNSLSLGGYVSVILNKYGRMGVEALRAATPIDTGKTADSWYYEVKRTGASGYELIFKNSNINKGVPIAIILQYGHGTKTGGYVQGRDYINPVMRDLFDKMSRELWKEVRDHG